MRIPSSLFEKFWNMRTVTRLAGGSVPLRALHVGDSQPVFSRQVLEHITAYRCLCVPALRIVLGLFLKNYS